MENTEETIKQTIFEVEGLEALYKLAVYKWKRCVIITINHAWLNGFNGDTLHAPCVGGNFSSKECCRGLMQTG
ncbi:hypothetical protein CDAR_4601 [Caerostris darwini]|uniref:Uncharacterized protein n=1 Tax=Caerostris darwini TaxID=1538125 RepID=A0AAV4S6G9_9ARAC|nr:hypothetical protein CDAR_4601 [Caerostris darwini]